MDRSRARAVGCLIYPWCRRRRCRRRRWRRRVSIEPPPPTALRRGGRRCTGASASSPCQLAAASAWCRTTGCVGAEESSHIWCTSPLDGLAGIDFCARLHVRVQLFMTGWITTLDKKEFVLGGSGHVRARLSLSTHHPGDPSLSKRSRGLIQHARSMRAVMNGGDEISNCVTIMP